MAPIHPQGLHYAHITAADDPTIDWHGTFATYGGSGSDGSITVPFWIEPGGHLGWHTDSIEETQVIISGYGELRTEEGVWPVAAGDMFVLPALARHDLANAGSEPLRAVAFFSGPALTQVFDNMMLPPNSHTLRSPNAGG